MSLTLYHCPPSPPSRCALHVIRALKLDVKIEHVDLFSKAQLRPEFVAINPQHCVPTLDDGGFILWESRAIASYLASKYDSTGKLYPQGNAQENALVDRLLYFDAGSMFPSIRAIAFPALFLGEKKISKEKRDKLNDVFGFLNAFLEGKKWVAGGADYTVADISILSSTLGIVVAGWDISAFPNVQKWLENCTSIPGYEENKEGATVFGNAVKSKLDAGEI